MTTLFLPRHLLPAIAALLLSVPVSAQPVPQRPVAPERGDESRPAPQLVVTTDQDARETRTDFEAVLKRLPPSVGRVMRLDPTLMRNPAYLAAYPSLAAFLQTHPDVIQNPSFYLENVSSDFWQPRQPEDPRVSAIRLWSDMMQGLTIAAVVIACALGLLWIMRTLLDYRRWHRTAKVQTEVHTKLLDRFTSNEDLMAYMQTPAGRRFLESAPLPLDAPARSIGAPLSRIMWSLQVGVVLATGALGILFISGRVIEEVAQVMFALGVIVLALGAGFIVSAAASFLLSRRLGLLDSPGASREAGSPGVTSA